MSISWNQPLNTVYTLYRKTLCISAQAYSCSFPDTSYPAYFFARGQRAGRTCGTVTTLVCRPVNLKAKVQNFKIRI